MAEGIARQIGPDGLDVQSAGSAPGTLHPLAVEVMREVGIDIAEQQAKGVDGIDSGRVGTVITLCAEEVCPVFPGEVVRDHWPFEDPAGRGGTREQQLQAFRRVRDGIRRRLEAYFGLSGGDS